MKKINIILSTFIVASLLVFSNCGKPTIDYKFNDKNCVIGQEKEVKKNRFIGMYKKVSNKAKIIVIGVKPTTETINFDSSTKWNLGDIKTKKELAKKKGCVAIDFKPGTKYQATAITVLKPYAPPADQLIDNAQFLKLAGIPPKLKADVVVVDSRPTSKWEEGSVPGSISVPLGALKKGTGFKKLPKDKLIIFYCGGFHCKLAPFSGKLAVEKGYKVKVYWAGYPDWKKKPIAGFVQTSYIKKMLSKKMPLILLDIRKNAKASHIPGAFAASMSGNFKSMMPKGEKNLKSAPVIVYGQGKKDCKDAFTLANKIKTWGYKNVTVLAGGFDAYIKQGAPVASNKLIKKIHYVAKKLPGETSAKEFVAMIKNGIPKDVILVDVRGEAEIVSNPGATLLGAKNLPLPNLKETLSSLDKTKRIYTFCATGMRAELARNTLAKAGFKKAFFVKAKVSSPNGGLTLDKISLSAKQIEKITGKKISKKKVSTHSSSDEDGVEGC